MSEPITLPTPYESIADDLFDEILETDCMTYCLGGQSRCSWNRLATDVLRIRQAALTEAALDACIYCRGDVRTVPAEVSPPDDAYPAWHHKRRDGLFSACHADRIHTLMGDRVAGVEQ